MALENASFIKQLNPSNPDGSVDTVSTIDEHLRLIKNALKNSFPNINGEVKLSHTEINALKDTFTLSGNTVSLGNRNITNVQAIDLDHAVQPRSYNDARYPLKSQNLTWVTDRTASIDHLLGGLQGGNGLTHLRNLLLGMFFPVNSIFLSYNSASPGTYMGGTWELIGADRAIVGAGYSWGAGALPGSNSTSLSITHMPPHQHGLNTFLNSSLGGGSSGPRDAISVDSGQWHGHAFNGQRITDSAGSGAAFSLIQASIAMYIWRRIG